MSSGQISVHVAIPENWFLVALTHEHSPIIRRGDRHEPKLWGAAIQHVDGGRISQGAGATPTSALLSAINNRREPEIKAQEKSK